MSDPPRPAPHPADPGNPPGLARLRYRPGDFHAFRRAALRPLPGETALAEWRPSERGDLLLQAVEWWAAIAEVLGRYTERSLNESLIGTATSAEAVRGLVALLGYRPRPPIAATAHVAGLVAGARPVTLPAGFGVDSKPAPGRQPQRFETVEETVLGLPDAVPATPPGRMAAGGELFLAGRVQNLRAGDLLVLEAEGGGTRLLLTLAGVRNGGDAAGPWTALSVAGATLPAGGAAGWRLLRSGRQVGLWKAATTVNLVSPPLELEGTERGVAPGDLFVLAAAGLAPALRVVTEVLEAVWYLDGNAAYPPDPPKPGIGVPHTRLSYVTDGLDTTAWNASKAAVRVLLDWRPAGTLRDAPEGPWQPALPARLRAAPPGRFRPGASRPVLIEDATGAGVLATATVTAADPAEIEILSVAGGALPPLVPPLRILHGVVALTRGQGVPREVLGSGDAALAGQEFTLARAPLTCLAAGDGWRSTLEVFVDGVRWREVPSFFGQPPDAAVYVTREAEDGRTRVLFGDGENGARLPSGRDNVVARYRFGGGAAAPGAGELTVIASPRPGLRALRAPVAATGGADRDPPERLRRHAARSVLTFGRAVAAEDYAAIAAGAPGVARVRSVYAWDAEAGRAAVSLIVGDDAAAVEGARAALRLAADPNRPVAVSQAEPVRLRLVLPLRLSPDRVAEEVVAALRDALAAPEGGLLGTARAEIGRSLHLSEISEACLAVPGVESLGAALILLPRPDPLSGRRVAVAGRDWRVAVAEHEVLLLAPGDIAAVPEGVAHA